MGRLEEDAWYLMERYKFSWEEVMAMAPEMRARLVEGEGDPPSSEAPAEGEAPEDGETPEEAPAEDPAKGKSVDDYVGPRVGDIVGDTRRLKIISIDPMSGMDSAIVGEAWQSESGQLHGSGLAAVMLFEPTVAARYERTSVALDISPLTVLHARIARSAFMRAELVDDDNA
jgi:hypothetical protein